MLNLLCVFPWGISMELLKQEGASEYMMKNIHNFEMDLNAVVKHEHSMMHVFAFPLVWT